HFTYDNEQINPYYYRVTLDEKRTSVQYAPSHQSALYEINFSQNEPAYLIFNSIHGNIRIDGNKVYAWQHLDNGTQVYLYAETDIKPENSGVLNKGTGIDSKTKAATGNNVAVALHFGNKPQTVKVRYGVSFISVEQAEKNLKREIKGYDLKSLADAGRSLWNSTLGKIQVEGINEDDKVVFYTSLYRCFERAVNISEDGRYYSAFDGKIHKDKMPFYTDDWIWDTYRATHPLRMLIDQDTESDIINSFIRMAEQMDN